MVIDSIICSSKKSSKKELIAIHIKQHYVAIKIYYFFENNYMTWEELIVKFKKQDTKQYKIPIYKVQGNIPKC